MLSERVADGWVIRNGEERIVLRHLGEELYAVPVFGGSWEGRWEGEEWRGHWTDSLRPGDYRVPLTLTPLVNPHSTSGSKTASRWDTSEGTLLLHTKARFRVGHHLHADRRLPLSRGEKIRTTY